MIKVTSTHLPRPRLKTPSFVGETLRTIIFVVAVTVLFDMTIPRSLVDGTSMQPTFQDGERLVVSRMHYLLADPERGDVVVFNSLNPNEAGVMLIKRVVGLPGETLEIREGQVYINGELLDEPYTKEPCNGFRCPDGVWELASDEYFMMGDNRNVSQDSRRFGPVGKDHIVGVVLFRYWPIERIGIIAPKEYNLEQ